MTVGELMNAIFREAQGPRIEDYEVQMADCLPVTSITVDDAQRVIYVSDFQEEKDDAKTS